MIKTTKRHEHPVQHQLKFLLSELFGVAIILMMQATQADTLRDPTQPPAALYGNADSVAAAPMLQSVMMGPQYRAAIINGQKVLLGQKYEQATLIRLNEHEAVLRNPDMSTQTLVIDYAIEKKIVSSVAVPPLVKARPIKKRINSQAKLNTLQK